MAGLGTKATTLIITKGLATAATIGAGNTILTFGAGITPFFRLYIEHAPPPPPVNNYVAAAGSRVYQPGEYAASWKPVDPTTGQTTEEPWFIVPRDKENQFFNKSKIVKIEIVFGNKKMEKIYSVNENKAKTIIEIANVINATKQRVSVAVSGVKRVASTALVEVRNLVLRRKPNK